MSAVQYVLTAPSGAKQEQQQRRHRELGTDERRSVLGRHFCPRLSSLCGCALQKQASVGRAVICMAFARLKERSCWNSGVDRPCMDLQSARRGNYRKAGRAQRRERGKRDGSAAVAVSDSDDVHRSPMHACNCKGTSWLPRRLLHAVQWPWSMDMGVGRGVTTLCRTVAFLN